MIFLALSLAFAGCVTIPTGPSVAVMPGSGKTFGQFQADDAVCRQWASQQIGQSPRQAANLGTAQGAAAGTVIGTGLGAAIGAASSHLGEGAAIGAGTGLLFGTAAGANAGEYSGWSAQRSYDIAYEQCMYAKGNLIPGMRRQAREDWSIPPPPPPPPSE